MIRAGVTWIDVSWPFYQACSKRVTHGAMSQNSRDHMAVSWTDKAIVLLFSMHRKKFSDFLQKQFRKLALFSPIIERVYFALWSSYITGGLFHHGKAFFFCLLRSFSPIPWDSHQFDEKSWEYHPITKGACLCAHAAEVPRTACCLVSPQLNKIIQEENMRWIPYFLNLLRSSYRSPNPNSIPMTKQNTETEKEMYFYLYSTGIPGHQR